MEQKKKALGRGLEQLFSSEVLDFETLENNIMESAKESDIVEIPVSEIRPNPYQPRKSFNQELKRSTRSPSWSSFFCKCLSYHFLVLSL